MSGRCLGGLAVLLLATAACSGTGARSIEIVEEEIARDVVVGEVTAAELREAGNQVLTLPPELDVVEQPLTLAAALRTALAHSERLRVRGERVFVEDLRRRQAIAAVLPKAILNAGYTKDSDEVAFQGRTFSPDERTNLSLTVRQPLVDARLFPTLDAIEHARSIEAVSLRGDRDEVLFATAAAFYEVLGFEADARAFAASLGSAAEFLRVLTARFEVGETTEQQVRLAEANRDAAKTELVRAEHQIEAARARLGELMGVDVLPARLLDTMEIASVDESTPHLIDRGLAERLDLAVARLEVDRAEARESVALAAYAPKVDLDFTHLTHSEGGFDEQLDWTLGVVVEWDLFDSGGREARLASARSAIRQRELELRRIEKQARREVQEAALAYRSLEASLEAFESRAISAQAAADLVDAEYLAGEATNLDVLVAQRAREEAVRDVGRARLGLKLALLRVRLVVGDLRTAEPVRSVLEGGS